MREVKIAVVGITDYMGNPIAHILYVDGKRANVDSQDVETMVSFLPTDCLNEFDIDHIIPNNLKDLSKLVDKD
jgi:hypothetical protein